MNTKQILKEYVDACELIKETEADIARLRKKKKTIVQTNVRGSNPNFPYQEQHFRIAGSSFSFQDDMNLRYEEKLLEERKKHAEEVRLRAQEVINQAPIRIQRIIRMRYMQGMSWNRIADKMGRSATEDSLRKELDRFLKEN